MKHNPTLQSLSTLIGQWDVEALNEKWQETFEWLDDSFILWRADAQGDFPGSNIIIGRDETQDLYTALYYDTRGVARIYNLSFSDGVLKLWRDDPSFPQRFQATLSEDNNTLTGYWESGAGGKWKRDFDITYRRV